MSKWIPKGFKIDDEFNCLTNAENLADANPKLRFTVGRARSIGEKKWGDHAWCVAPDGSIVDPYFDKMFPQEKIEYKEDNSVFEGHFKV